MLHTAEFGTGNLVFAEPGCGQPHGKRKPGYGVLLDAELWHKEAVNDILAAQEDPNWAVQRHSNDVLRQNIIAAGAIFRIDADVIAYRVIDELRTSPAELPVGARVTNVP